MHAVPIFAENVFQIYKLIDAFLKRAESVNFLVLGAALYQERYIYIRYSINYL